MSEWNIHTYISTCAYYRVAKTHRTPQVAGCFCKRATSYRALLQKMTYKDKASYGSSPPCISSPVEGKVAAIS